MGILVRKDPIGMPPKAWREMCDRALELQYNSYKTQATAEGHKCIYKSEHYSESIGTAATAVEARHTGVRQQTCASRGVCMHCNDSSTILD